MWACGSAFRDLIRDHTELVAIIACGALFAVLPLDVLSDAPVLCPIRRFTEHPCPTCGVTRSVLCLTQGEFSRAWELNPAGFLLVLAVVKHVCARMFRTRSWAMFLRYQFLDIMVLIGFFGFGFLHYFGAL